uniref:Papilin-like isoform X2 n=1 Tax=Pogona vitticeps TaxID=103695 RepID=A0ABM5G4T9_9SAUR
MAPDNGKSRTCPECSEPSGTCVTLCSTDDQCPGEQCCCSCGCSRKCMLPVEAHPGSCPAPSSPGQTTDCLANCTTDTECGSGEKCCRSGCRNTCVPAEPDHPGVCPQKEVLEKEGPCNSSCTDDRDCPESQKCCFSGCGLQCMAPDNGKSRTCPECSEPSGKCVTLCSTDDQCPGEERCCSCGCSRKCMLPVEAHPGSCPAPSSPGQTTDCLANCTTDTECGSGEKCCSSGCLTTCVPAEPDHPGVCPQKEVLEKEGPCNSSCTDDRHCPESQKCCFSGCGLQCMDMETDICKLPAEAGPCKAYMPMFYYSPKTKMCEVFIYGGCGGNENRFSTMQECLWNCRYRDICKLPMDQGHCDGHKITYYYNHANRTCEHFTYHSCGGNENRFRTLEQCLTTCFYPEVCKLPAESGPCLAYIPMYYYDHRNKTCRRFVYGGCGGNGNRFPTLEHCKQRCRNPDICVLPPETGPCNHYSSMYHYAPAEERCLPFPYGGCKGNANRFPTLEVCTETCGSQDICWLPVEPGPCLGSFPRFYYNPVNKTCEKFIFGGCGGNENQFETLIECIWRCRNPAICRLPMDHGEGNHSITMYHYDPIGTVCEQFTYGGQRGNSNRFATLVECQETCRDPDVCKLPQKPGPCEGQIQRFYHNSTSRLCMDFQYGGCRGNKNNFLTQKACQLTCLGPEKPGSCPPGDPAECLVACQKDCDCPGPKKCCGTACGQGCKDPVKV